MSLFLEPGHHFGIDTTTMVGGQTLPILNKLMETPLSVKNNGFAQILLNYFQKTNQSSSVVYSPFSIFYLMELVYMGSNGKTREELGKILGVELETESQTIKDMIHFGRELESSGSVKMANGFFIERSYKDFIRDSFRELMEKIGKLEECNFQNGALMEVEKINTWVKKQTMGLVPCILEPSDIDTDTKLVLVNTLYFKDKWLNCFQPEKTKTGIFNNLLGGRYPLDLMHQKGQFEYYDNEQFQILSMKYVGGEVVMDIFLPKNLGKKNMETVLSDHLNYDLDQVLMEQEVEVIFPKFKQRNRQSLAKAFSDLGAKRMFTANAEFANLVVPPPGDDNHVYISDIIHECVVIVDEEKTEAAAATCVMLRNECCVEERKPKVFKADHSFLYQIRYSNNGLVLFHGVFDGQSED